MIQMGGIVYTCEHVIDEHVKTYIAEFYLSHAPEGFDRLEFVLCWHCLMRFGQFKKYIPGLDDSEIILS